MKNTEAIEKVLGISFNNKKLLREALTHKSYANDQKEKGFSCPDNERLEFLGDSILGLIVAGYLFEKYPNRPEGELTRIRAALVGEDACVELAKKLGLADSLIVSESQVKANALAKGKVLGQALEAIIGAIYLDRGYQEAKAFVLDHIPSMTERIVAEESWIDPKTKFQEESHRRLAITPSYKTLGVTGGDNDRTFTVGVYLDDELVAEGVGSSKQSAAKSAARNALKAKNW